MEKETMLSLERLGVDTESALARFMNNGALYEKFLRRFVQDQNYAALTEAVREGRIALSRYESYLKILDEDEKYRK